MGAGLLGLLCRNTGLHCFEGSARTLYLDLQSTQDYGPYVFSFWIKEAMIFWHFGGPGIPVIKDLDAKVHDRYVF